MNGVRGLMHVHSSYSYDSRTPLAHLRDLAVAHGYAFIVQTEHSNELTPEAHARYRAEASELSAAGPILAAGIEYASEDNAVHVLAIGDPAFHAQLRLFPMARLGELLDRVRDGGGLTILAHPERAGALDRVPSSLRDRFDGIEVWNGKTDRWLPSPRALAEVARRRRGGTPTIATVGLDLHAVREHREAGVVLPEAPRDEAHLVEMLRASPTRVYMGPWFWRPESSGAPLRAACGLSRAALAGARRIKHLAYRAVGKR